MHKQLFRMVVVILALLAFPLTGAVLAQDNTPTLNTIELVGTITAVKTGTITVNSQVIDITQAEVKVTVEIDAAVKVEGTLLDDGSIIAREVKAAATGMMPNEIEFVGTLSSLDDNSAIVAGLTFDLTSAEVDPTALIGETVIVHASLSATGVWAARELERFASDDVLEPESTPEPGDTRDELEIVGTLEQVMDGSIAVSGMNIDTTGAEIKDLLVVGALVKVHMSLIDGQLVAREVENALEEEDDFDSSDDQVTLPANCTAQQPAGWTAYVVQQGDTLRSLARLLDTSVETLATVNCIADPNNLTSGAVIYGPTHSSDDSSGDHSGQGNGGSDDDSNDDHGGQDSSDDDSHDDDHNNNDDNSGHGSSSDDDHGDD